MPPHNVGRQTLPEKSPLIADKKRGHQSYSVISITGSDNDSIIDSDNDNASFIVSKAKTMVFILILSLGVFSLYRTHFTFSYPTSKNHGGNNNSTDKGTTSSMEPIGPYKLIENQEGMDFFNYYTFYDGADSEGSAGYISYVSEEKAKDLGIVGVTTDSETHEDFVYMKSSSTSDGPRSSIRLEGKNRFDRGLFILDLRHMPSGPGVWPAFWLTNEETWPRDGEIDVVEGINFQSVAKTALHTSKDCSMFAHVPDQAKTGTWEWSTGLPDTYTGIPDYKTVKEADNCWEWAPHQWFNQGCVSVSSEEGTLGKPLNQNGGGIYALEWDPANKYIRSWVFTPHETAPMNILDTIRTSGEEDETNRVTPDTDLWGLPYAYFAIGEDTGCSADHFKNMRVVFNLAFCGTVAGNRFFKDCPIQAKAFNVSDNAVDTCNAFIKSDSELLDEAYWKIKGLYVYEREMASPSPSNNTNNTDVLV